MGTKATKMEGSYLPDTPTLNRLRIAGAAVPQQSIKMSTSPCRDNNSLLDPRSPNICRTPLNPTVSQMPPQLASTGVGSENTFTQLRKRLLKGFSLNDPRSPQLNRTPLMLDAAIDRTLNMDDTFSDLFVETRAPAPAPVVPAAEPPHLSHNNSSVEIVSLPYDEEETMPCEMMLQRTPPLQSHDPRSPSVGVERTPIIFCDDDETEARDTQMLEEILETLTLNLSNESSMASFVSASAEMTLDEPQPQEQAQEQPQLQPRPPANKHLERVRLGNKRRVAPRKPARASKPKIYVDAPEGLTSTPKSTPDSAHRTQRTPLSCVNKNRIHLRSRSVEKDLRKPQLQLPLQSFDDQLNPSERLNVPSLRLLMSADYDG
ncbi:uncharacterized protein msb1l isoform X2 [Drosophila virilis]|uniref:Uncharacterized protein, isoform B n=1 Tax=Drosophila virilis TaxID=7244 RepID=A0A0Q9WBI7_DROVI|nr:uncharacterized protein LOC6633927 isoform X2 [Drosophila virilis]KRF77893.1 uncharacterized protein Dvir_GJ18232, isoform B [Drosophila virilis]